jgi:N4-gp56 family major capsid protein
MAVQTYSGLTAEQKQYYDRTLLSRLVPNLVFLQHGQKKPIPKREGATVNFRRFNSLPVITEPLTEGVPPAGSSLDITTITATVQGYGDYVLLSDFLDMAGIDPVATETLEAQGEQAAVSLDTIVRNVVAAGTNVLYAEGTARNQITSAGILTALLCRKARKIMARNNVKPYAKNEYLAFIHPDAAYDLMGDPAWVNANQYAGSTQIFNGELGKLYGIRFIETTLAPIFVGAGSGGIDVYATLVIGRDAYVIPDIAGSSKPESIVKPLGSAGTADPLNQQSSVGWKAYLTAVRLQELAILRIEHAVSS